MKNKFAFVWLLSMIIPGLLLAQEPPKPKQMHMKMGEKGCAIAAILDQNQQQKWEVLRVNFQKERNEIMAKLKNARLDLQQLMKSQRLPDEGMVSKKLDEIGKLTDQLRRNAHAQKMEFRKLITDEQWQKVQELRKEKPMRHQGMRMRHDGFPGDFPEDCSGDCLH